MTDDATRFERYADIVDVVSDLPASDSAARGVAEARNLELTKPPGALGRLEDLAIWRAGWKPGDEPAQVIVFAGNHGVAKRGVSPYPSAVTAQMVANFHAGGAAINQICRIVGAELRVIALDLDTPTQDFTHAPAMSEAECCAAISAGWTAVKPHVELLAIGEMGIGNTSSASAICSALLGRSQSETGWIGPGAGAEGGALQRKREIIEIAVLRHIQEIGGAGGHAPLEALGRLGGREIAAMFGAILRARIERLPVLLDGFICSSAALVLHSLKRDGLTHCMAAHCSAEPAHEQLLRALELQPLLDLEMRLGEGSGAALAIGIVRAATACHEGMATFAEAGVSDKQNEQAKRD